MYLVRKVYLLEELVSSYIIIRVFIIIIREIFNWESKVIQDCIGFNSTSFCDWSKKLVSLSQPIRCKSNTNRDLVARFSCALGSLVVFYHEFPSACKDLFLSSDWLLWFLLFCFNDTQSKSTRLENKS